MHKGGWEMIGFETLERGGDLPDPRIIELIRNPQHDEQTLRLLGRIATGDSSIILRSQSLDTHRFYKG
jgi:hypothetical protein